MKEVMGDLIISKKVSIMFEWQKKKNLKKSDILTKNLMNFGKP